jgi:hypothetical protein
VLTNSMLVHANVFRPPWFEKTRTALLSDIVKRRSIRMLPVVMSRVVTNIQALFNRTLSGRSRNKLVFLSVLKPNVKTSGVHAEWSGH